ncbi:MAG: serine-type D-Ala-D-Ala carboxypeptidase, partial [Gammaproteobacteria bacterium]|nr:serine-type D-Ala-D-Ala carboxypeptidase [Gammaproteobacteria bacterium]
VGVTHNVYVTVPKGGYKELAAALQTPAGLMAPIPAGAPAGTLNLSYDGKPLNQIPLYALRAVPEGNIFRRLYDSVLLLLGK